MATTIKGAFGEGFDASTYLNRFFDFEFGLPRGDFKAFAKRITVERIARLVDNEREIDPSTVTCFAEFFSHHTYDRDLIIRDGNKSLQITPRDVERILNRFSIFIGTLAPSSFLVQRTGFIIIAGLLTSEKNRIIDALRYCRMGAPAIDAIVRATCHSDTVSEISASLAAIFLPNVNHEQHKHMARHGFSTGDITQYANEVKLHNLSPARIRDAYSFALQSLPIEHVDGGKISDHISGEVIRHPSDS
ncbi:hypothetical protein [Cerasicoccus maritimus]|uniref:hypothetical protein n=1 Tax=Cerasicoccus maritimus TaxID=490089 RepID=UPI002852AD24|nr:hypothetical protein [Cerasicoccus maritimus]